MDEHLTLEGLQMIWERNHVPESRTLNYFNYFTEIEEHFQRARGTGLFLLSPLDWALIESWKNAGVPLEAVLRGIDAAFEKWRSRKVKTQMVNSLAFCAQAVLTEAQVMAGTGAAGNARRPRRPFRWTTCAPTWKATPRAVPYPEIAESLRKLAAEVEQHYTRPGSPGAAPHRAGRKDDRRCARTSQTEEQMLEARQDLDRQLRPYRGKMTADQLSMLEKQYLERNLLEKSSLPRLSLFYMR